MRIRDKKKQNYDRFRYLLEFQVKKGPKNLEEQDETEGSSDVFGQISDVIDGKEPNPNTTEPLENNQQPSEISDEVVADVDINDNQTFDDTVSDLLKVHSSKIDNLTKYINDSVKILQVLSQKTDDIESNFNEMGDRVNQLSSQVDNLTPPTPLESLNQMVKNTTGGQSIEDYWNEYFKKHGRPDMVSGSIYYGDKQYSQNEKGMNSGVYKTPQMSDNDIKDIIKNS